MYGVTPREKTKGADVEEATERLAQSIREKQRVLVFTGAGASADSGIPTFRVGWTSLWKGVLGPFILPFFGTPWGWTHLPGIAWRLYDWVARSYILKAQPNAFHRLLGQLHAEGKEVLVITQNVDGLHQKGGVPSERVFEVHGTLWRNVCSNKNCARILSEDDPAHHHPLDKVAPVPMCPDCGSFPRPAAILFNDWFCHHTHGDLLDELQKDMTDATVMVVGISGMVGSADQMIAECKSKTQVFCIDPNWTRYAEPYAQNDTTWIPAKAGAIAEKINEMLH